MPGIRRGGEALRRVPVSLTLLSPQGYSRGMTDNTDTLHTQLTNTVPCTLCGKVEVAAPASIEEDPLCVPCIQALLQKVAADSMSK